MLAGDFHISSLYVFILHCKMYIRMVEELVLMAIVMITTDPEDKSYVRYRCGAPASPASTELFVKFKSAVPGNSEIHDSRLILLLI